MLTITDFMKAEKAYGLSYPDWEAVRQEIAQGPASQAAERWQEIVLSWLRHTAAELGKEYSVRRAARFALLSALSEKKAETILASGERFLERIEKVLPELAGTAAQGSYVIVVLAREERYYDYMAFFHAEGEYGASAGCYINQGYGHMVMHGEEVDALELALAQARTRRLLAGRILFPAGRRSAVVL